MSEAWILDAVRTPVGRRKGRVSRLHPQELVVHLLHALEERDHLDPAQVEDVILGCVTNIGEQGFNIARMSVLAAGWPVEVPGTTVNRMCASSLQAFNFAAQAIRAGDHDLLVAGGVESMTRVEMGSDGGPMSRPLQERFDLVPQGISAELIAERWRLAREELDAYSYESHQRALRATDRGHFQGEIVPLPVPAWEDQPAEVLAVDEGPRRDTSPEKMATLQPAFKPDGVVTAGNSSQISDGASLVLVSSPERAKSLGLRPRARVVATAVVGVDPVIMLTGPIPATRKVLQKAGLTLDQMDVVEINEAFASVVLAWQRELDPDMTRVNPNGGAIALGHPLGASGTRLLATALNELERREGRYALITLCIGFGQAVATIIERIQEARPS
ncbi:thiolase family protein [Limnochorda pilosa]|uniref:Acetyl-CoA acetyltransferase n=1 Tax=Limnochorda pilosa TaxID=1555112 RepID=A0A0K2SG53_LIMPI|nr:thiolase family protein [Limnochorda pilosa]BAS26081.1 acetyl-CoA acetyltransferase [Limnochorda pilosa]